MELNRYTMKVCLVSTIFLHKSPRSEIRLMVREVLKGFFFCELMTLRWLTKSEREAHTGLLQFTCCLVLQLFVLQFVVLWKISFSLLSEHKNLGQKKWKLKRTRWTNLFIIFIIIFVSPRSLVTHKNFFLMRSVGACQEFHCEMIINSFQFVSFFFGFFFRG